MVPDVGGGVGIDDDAWCAVSPHAHQNDARVPFFAQQASDGDVSLDGIKEGAKVPKYCGVVGFGERDCFCDGVPFVGGPDQVASFDGGVS